MCHPQTESARSSSTPCAGGECSQRRFELSKHMIVRFDKFLSRRTTNSEPASRSNDNVCTPITLPRPAPPHSPAPPPLHSGFGPLLEDKCFVVERPHRYVKQILDIPQPRIAFLPSVVITNGADTPKSPKPEVGPIDFERTISRCAPIEHRVFYAPRCRLGRRTCSLTRSGRPGESRAISKKTKS